MQTLTRFEAQQVYNRIGRGLDTQGFYEDPAREVLYAHGEFDRVHAVLEFGCGTGKMALMLLGKYLSADSRYLGVDISPVMIQIASRRLAPWGTRAKLVQTDGSMRLPAPDQSHDRFVATYVLDLLSIDDARQLLREAHRILVPGGLLCVASITPGRTRLARLVMGSWKRLGDLSPKLVGGCRPIALSSLVETAAWRTTHHEFVTKFGVSSEVLVAERRQTAAATG